MRPVTVKRFPTPVVDYAYFMYVKNLCHVFPTNYNNFNLDPDFLNRASFDVQGRNGQDKMFLVLQIAQLQLMYDYSEFHLHLIKNQVSYSGYSLTVSSRFSPDKSIPQHHLISCKVIYRTLLGRGPSIDQFRFSILL